MKFTCPYCHSSATLAPNPAHGERSSAPRYMLTCTGCDRTSVRRDPINRLRVALTRH